MINLSTCYSKVFKSRETSFFLIRNCRNFWNLQNSIQNKNDKFKKLKREDGPRFNLKDSLNHAKMSTQIKDDNEIDEFLNDKEYMHLKNELFRSPISRHNQRVLIVQPYLKNQKIDSTPELMLDETANLAESIPNWTVVHKSTMELKRLLRYDIFRFKQLDKIIEDVNTHNADIVVIGLDWLNGSYQLKIEKEFDRQVYDRYSMILRIFHQRSATKEARLQTALAEIPYIRSRLNLFSRNPDHHQASLAIGIGTRGKDYYNERKFLLDKREKSLKKALAKIENSRSLLNPAKRTNKVPIVGIVGYTNCGKSSLIKHFTRNESIQPMNKLFATLDLSRFIVKLNNNQDVFLLDTIGFISNIPENLLDAFKSTLKEIVDCDLIVHIYDTNHPDLDNQKKTVYKTLFDQIKLTDKLKSTMIEVGNKIDLLSKDRFEEFLNENSNHLFISVTNKTNLQVLADRIQEALEKNLDLLHRKFKVSTGSEQYQFIVENSLIKDQKADEENPNYSILDVSISKKNYHHLMNILKKKE